MIDVPTARFERLVSEAIDLIPDDLFALIDNVVFLVEEANEEEPSILGLYDGVPLTERESYGIGEFPDRIFIYRRGICAICESEDQVRDEVVVTVIHEVAHHFGIDDDRLHELGWD
ncbi:MAG: metallopeptidase family protein [Actinomycetota bacterium]